METTLPKRRHLLGRVLLCFLILVVGGIAYFFYCLNRGLETKPQKLIEFYELAKAHRWEEMTRRGCYETDIFQTWEEERGPIQSIKIKYVELWVPVWGEIHGTVYRAGKPYHVIGYLENDTFHYIDEEK